MVNRWDVAILNYEKATIAYKEIASEDQVRKVRLRAMSIVQID